MEDVRKSLSALWIMLVELGAVFLTSVTIAGIVNELRPGTFAASHDIDGTDWAIAAVGPLLMAWVLNGIFRPRVKVDNWRAPPTGPDFRFCTTHPSYVLIDLLTIGFASGFYWLGVSGDFAIGGFRLLLGLALFIAAARLSAWYLLGLKIEDQEADGAHRPAIWAFGIIAGTFGLAMLVGSPA